MTNEHNRNEIDIFPNVVICFSDMLRSFALGCYGNDCVQTPNIDRLAGEGVLFELGITNNPVCVPARLSLMSGQYSRTCMGGMDRFHGFWPDRGERHCLKDPTLAECMKEAGYATALIGKWHIEIDPLLLGFEHALYPNAIHCHYRQEYVEDQDEPFVVDEFAPDFETRRLDDYIRKHRDTPFFLFYNIS